VGLIFDGDMYDISFFAVLWYAKVEFL